MATDDFLIPIDESDTSEMCTQFSNKFGQQSSNEIGPQVSSPSNFNIHTEVEVIEGELDNSIRKPMKKSLEEDPNQLFEMSWDSIDWIFYKVPDSLRQVDEKAYEPSVISIGPYHHGKKHLETMEVIKRNCFRRMIKNSTAEPGKFVTVMKKLEKHVRKGYEEPLDRFDSDTLVKMMVLDGCFIVLLFQGNKDLLTSLLNLKKGILDEICCDLLLLENQLPFFVLLKLYDVINMSTIEINEFSRSAFYLLSKVIPVPDICVPEKFPKPKDMKHLLGLVYHCWLLSAGKRLDAKAKETKAQSLWKFIGTESEEEGIGRKGKRSRKLIRCATELEEVGINFVKYQIWEAEQDKKGKASLFNVEVTDDGTLKIATLSVNDNTERILCNFMVYEHFLKSSKPTYVSDYVTLMNNLIKSGKDVQLLCNREIIDNSLCDEKVVVQMFKKLGNFTCSSIDSDDFYYAEIFNKVNYHCKRRSNMWKAELKRSWIKWKDILEKDYFNSPWSIIKLLAAFVLLLLTVVQTVYSVLSYDHPK